MQLLFTKKQLNIISLVAPYWEAKREPKELASNMAPEITGCPSLNFEISANRKKLAGIEVLFGYS